MDLKESVELFLRQFHQKMKVFRIIFRDDRGKNIRALVELEITPAFRESVVGSLTVTDYSEGPFVDTLYGLGEIWVFGKVVKGREVYIKICLGRENSQTICISFHLAEYRMKYPFK